MDLADRYVNSECVKRMLQADQVFICLSIIFDYQLPRHRILLFSCKLCCFLVCLFLTIHVYIPWYKVALAEKTAVLFTKEGDQHNNLHDMQCMWLVYSNILIFCTIQWILWFNFLIHVLISSFLYLEGMSLPRVKAFSARVILDGLSRNF